MKWPLRFVLALYSILTAFISLLLVLYILGFKGPAAQLVNYSLQNASMRWTTGIIALLVLVLSVFTLVKSFGSRDAAGEKREPTDIFVKESKMGQVSISADALENVITKAARQVEGVREVTSEIKNTPQGAAIFIKALVIPSVSIPLISEELQNAVKERVREFAGIEAIEIRVFVENIAQEVRSGR
ncbi:MAG: alkaline shock response membrane anchor protein AmaP [Clostridia bacterium]|nr:alkaline shock response membrane anchor protein AmaP [Clostridia bacterium]